MTGENALSPRNSDLVIATKISLHPASPLGVVRVKCCSAAGNQCWRMSAFTLSLQQRRRSGHRGRFAEGTRRHFRANKALCSRCNIAFVQVKPKAPMGCKFVGTVRGTKLWLVIAQDQSLGARQPRRKIKPCLRKRPDQSRPIRKSKSLAPVLATTLRRQRNSLPFCPDKRTISEPTDTSPIGPTAIIRSTRQPSVGVAMTRRVPAPAQP
jgi:hypothetical protein